MPPWPPDAAYNHLAHERMLTASQKAKIAAWVTGNKPQGNPALAPPQPVFSNNGDIPGTANLTVQIPTYTSPAATTDMYRCFVLNGNQSVDKYITAFEAIPGNRGIVHHVLVYADTTGTCAQLDAADPGPGIYQLRRCGYQQCNFVGWLGAGLISGYVSCGLWGKASAYCQNRCADTLSIRHIGRGGQYKNSFLLFGRQPCVMYTSSRC